MPKGYWIAHVAGNDDGSLASDDYKAYVEGAKPAFTEFGAKFLARGGTYELAEGSEIGTRHVVIEFPSLEAAKACYHSDAYTKAKENRQVVSRGVIVLVEGAE